MKNLLLTLAIVVFFIGTLSMIDPSGFILIATSIYSILITLSFLLIIFFFIFSSLQQKSYIPLKNMAITFVFLLIIAGIYSTVQAFSSATFSLVVLFALPVEILGIAYYSGLHYATNKIIEKNQFSLKLFSLILLIASVPIYLLNIFLSIPV